MPAVIAPKCCKLCSASTVQAAEVWSIIFLLPWNSLVSILFALACAAGSVSAVGGEVVTGQEGCLRGSHPTWQQKQTESISRERWEILLPILHQSSPAKQPLPPTPARLQPPCPVTPASNPFLGLFVYITWFAESLLELLTTATQLGTRTQVRVKVLWGTMVRVSLGTNSFLKEKAECCSRNTPYHRILLLPYTIWYCLGCEHVILLSHLKKMLEDC